MNKALLWAESTYKEIRTKLLSPHSIGQIKSQASPYLKIGELDSESIEEQKAVAIYTNTNLAQNPSLEGKEEASKSSWAQSSKWSPPIFQHTNLSSMVYDNI